MLTLLLLFVAACVGQSTVAASWCSEAQSCEQCLGRIGPSGTQCVWCVEYSYGSGSLGCFDFADGCPSNSGSAYSCNLSGAGPIVGGLAFVTVSFVLGLVAGGLIYAKALATTDATETYKYIAMTYALSWLLLGASLFSGLLAFRARRLKMGRKQWHCCGSANVIVFTILEWMFILAGLLTSWVLDGVFIGALQYQGYGTCCYFPASLMIGIPVAAMGLLFGIGRIATSYQHLVQEPRPPREPHYHQEGPYRQQYDDRARPQYDDRARPQYDDRSRQQYDERPPQQPQRPPQHQRQRQTPPPGYTDYAPLPTEEPHQQPTPPASNDPNVRMGNVATPPSINNVSYPPPLMNEK